MASSKQVVINENGVNSYLTISKISRLYVAYGASTSETTAAQNVWERFPYPSGGTITTYRNSGDFTVHPSINRYTYTGASPKWFNVFATCNTLKATGANQSRTLEYQWYLNGVPVGISRRGHMNNEDASIVTGTGEIYLNQNDYLEPYIRNTENGDKIMVSNCTLVIQESPEYSLKLN